MHRFRVLCRQPAGGEGGQCLQRDTGVPHLQENAPPWDPTVGLCLGSKGGPRGVGVFMGEVPLYSIPCHFGHFKGRITPATHPQHNLQGYLAHNKQPPPLGLP